MKLSGVRALVTGGSRGIGRAIVEAFAQEGAAVLALGRSLPDLDETRRISPERISIQQTDLLDRSQVDELAARATDELGGLDVLVNNAGLWMEKPFLEYTRDDWDLTMAMNVTSVFDVTQALLPILMQSRSGRIINLAAIDGQVGFAKLVAQCTSKFGLIGMTKALAKELWESSITVNAICPAAVDKSVSYSETPSRLAGPETALPWDVARAAVYLASEEGVRVTGACIDVHGIGFLAA